jgi:phospholipid/cholesterol/gamma-HCH transport system ATP-binding protein
VGLRKTFGAHTALDGVDCEIPGGEISLIVGPAGAGKSVLLRHFVGLLKPDAGDVIVDGVHLPRLPEEELVEVRRGMGILFQDVALAGSMSLYDNVAFPLREHTRKPEREIREIVMARLREVGLAGAEGRMPGELWGELRKRAGFARALVLEPRILLFDEVDSGLDEVRTARLFELIHDIQRRHGSTVVVTSREARAGFEVAGHVLVLQRGRVVEQGSSERIRGSRKGSTLRFLMGAAAGPSTVRP